MAEASLSVSVCLFSLPLPLQSLPLNTLHPPSWTPEADSNSEYWRGVYNQRLEMLVDAGITIPASQKIVYS